MAKKKYIYYDVQPFSSIPEMMKIAQEQANKKIAYKFKNGDEVRKISYNEFCDTVRSLLAYLKTVGCDGKKIACIGPNSYKWITAYFAVLVSDGVFVPIDKELPNSDIENIINQSGCEIVFMSESFEEKFRENEEKFPSVKKYISFDRKENDGKYESFDEAVKLGSKNKVELLSGARDTDKLKMIVFTSGTTGIAKGVCLSEKNLVSSIYYGLQISTVYDVGLSILPYHHTYEAVSDILVSFHHHSTLCINESYVAIKNNLLLYKPSYVYVVPAIAEMLMTRIMREIKKNGKEKKFISAVKISNNLLKFGIDKRKTFFKEIHDSLGGRLKKIVCGGAPIRADVGEFFENIGISLVNGYGITECSPLVCANNDAFNDYHTAGIRLPCIEWRIDNPNDEGIGEICIKGDIVMMGYYNKPKETAEVLRDGWFYTGDYGKINEFDQLEISGRKKNIIVLNNGKNIYPEEIEGYIQGIDYVSEVIVSSETDEHGNEKSLKAEVFLAEKRTPAEVLKSIKKACLELPIYKQISNVVIRDKEFEKTTSNKIKRYMKKK